MSYLSPLGEGIVVMYAHLEEADVRHSRRGTQRRRLYLIADASQTSSSSKVEILNISATGFLMRCNRALRADESLSVVLSGEHEYEAEIAWSAESLFGCRFREELSKAAVSAILLRAGPARDVSAPAIEPALSEESFGQRLKRLRSASPYSMIEFAERVGVTKPTLWKWETDKVRPREKMIRRLAAELGIDEMSLLYGSMAAPHEDGENGLASVPSSPKRLADVISDSRDAIADHAGVSPAKVSVSIDWD